MHQKEQPLQNNNEMRNVNSGGNQSPMAQQHLNNQNSQSNLYNTQSVSYGQKRFS